jgi:adenylate cyclase
MLENKLKLSSVVFSVCYWIGKITVAEVGEIKTEIAYHGDVLNTASRIQNLCNQFDKRLLVSESLVERLNEEHRALASLVTELELKGKETKTKIFSLGKY